MKRTQGLRDGGLALIGIGMLMTLYVLSVAVLYGVSAILAPLPVVLLLVLGLPLMLIGFLVLRSSK